ncbi:unnamed protein product [Ceratitis capitata]|uniref:(Mediterranean fruit fly) hypothetical protein n=1 Tax=Ceratitis capitata TaxID=7213 RepID=A0A811UM82_CERCA|nr:unnamed protein product [Ceratitis capitata]
MFVWRLTEARKHQLKNNKSKHESFHAQITLPQTDVPCTAWWPQSRENCQSGRGQSEDIDNATVRWHAQPHIEHMMNQKVKFRWLVAGIYRWLAQSQKSYRHNKRVT